MPFTEPSKDRKKIHSEKIIPVKKTIKIERKRTQKTNLKIFSSSFKRDFFKWIRGLNIDDYPHQRSTINQFINWNKERTYVHLLELLEMYMEGL